MNRFVSTIVSMSDTDSEPAAASAEPDPLSSSRYAIPIDFAHPGDSRAVVLGLLAPEPSRILELGCSTGLMTQVMAERGHRVTAVEIDPVAASLAAPFAHEMFVGDLDSVEADGQHLLSELEAEGFDTVVAADVLEHLRDPTACLRRVLGFLKADGRVILSIPNVAHGDVRMSLLAGRFNYRDRGLLDRTHVQLFTLESLLAMIREVGLAPVEWKRVVVPLGGSEIEIDENLLEFGRRILAGDPEVETYQWIVTCQDPKAVDFEPAWPELRSTELTVSNVLGMMNSPSPHPGVQEAVVPADVVGATQASRFGRRIHRLLAWSRDQLVVRLVR